MPSAGHNSSSTSRARGQGHLTRAPGLVRLGPDPQVLRSGLIVVWSAEALQGPWAKAGFSHDLEVGLKRLAVARALGKHPHDQGHRPRSFVERVGLPRSEPLRDPSCQWIDGNASLPCGAEPCRPPTRGAYEVSNLVFFQPSPARPHRDHLERLTWLGDPDQQVPVHSFRLSHRQQQRARRHGVWGYHSARQDRPVWASALPSAGSKTARAFPRACPSFSGRARRLAHLGVYDEPDGLREPSSGTPPNLSTATGNRASPPRPRSYLRRQTA